MSTLRADADLIEVPSKDGIDKSFEIEKVRYFMDDREIDAPVFLKALFTEEN